MANKRSMSLVPPKKSIEDKLKDFIEEPDKKNFENETVTETETSSEDNEPEKNNQPIKDPLPWEYPGVTPEIIKPFVLRLQQPDKLKAEYVVKNSLDYRSLHEYFTKAILKQIDEDLEVLLNPKG